MKFAVPSFRSLAIAGSLFLAVPAAFAQAPAAPAPAAPNGPSIQQILTTPFTPSHLALATEVLQASGLKTMFENSMPNVVGALRVNVTRQRPELAKEIEESLKEVEKQSAAALNDGINGASRFLAIRMTEPELKEVSAFLATPTGKKYVETLPAFMDQVVPYLEIWGEETNARLGKVFQDEMAKRGHKL